MRTLKLTRYAPGVCALTVLLAGCSGSQMPIGAPGTIPKGSNVPTIDLNSALTAPNVNAVSDHHGVSPLSLSVLYKFGAHPQDGSYPDAGLIDVKGVLYGTTSQGGVHRNCPPPYDCGGTVFSVTTSGREKVLHSFAGGSDGAAPNAALIDVNGTLYGTTPRGGAYGHGQGGGGTVFSIGTSGEGETVLHSFGKGSDGAQPAASLIDVSGTFYGTTETGGAYGGGTVFSIATGGKEKVLHSFGKGSDGAYPTASIIDANGTLYGTTSGGGAYRGGNQGGGTVFSIGLKGEGETVLHSFGNGSDGAQPAASLCPVSGTLYGVTTYGGAHDSGTVFRITTGGKEKVLHSFGNGSDGIWPDAPLIDVKGTLYGTTLEGGVYRGSEGNEGTVYSITTSGTESVLHSFKGPTQGGHGVAPMAPLINVEGTFYGTTSSGGGPTGWGTVFALTP